MPPRTRAHVIFLACGAILAIELPLQGGVAPETVGQVDAVIVGKVTAIEENAVVVAKTDYHIAVIKIDETIFGVKESKTLRMSYEPGLRIGRRLLEVPTIGMEGIFALKKHPQGDFYIWKEACFAGRAGEPANFALTKRCAKLMVDPTASLKVDDAEDRLLTAGMLLGRYRGQPVGKEEPIDAAQSKLILEAMAKADWTQPSVAETSPIRAFNLLRLTPADGWRIDWTKHTWNDKEVVAAAQKWLTDNTATYRIRRFVPIAGK